MVSIVDPPSVFVVPESVEVHPNQSEEVTAFIAGHPDPKVFWTFDNVKIAEGVTLVLNSSMKPGIYTCVAENSEGRAEGTCDFKVLAEPKLLEDFDESKREKNVRKGFDFELLCPFVNFDEIVWMRNDTKIVSQKTSTLKIKNIDELSSGEYKCTASNLIGKKSFSYQVNLLTAPTIAVVDSKTSEVTFNDYDAQEVTIALGKTLNLECEAEGNPKPTTRWLKSDEEITSESSLNIESLTNDDAGTYTCIAENSLGRARKTVKVEVSSKPFIEDGKKKIWLDKFVGVELILECKINGSPEPNFAWIKDR